MSSRRELANAIRALSMDAVQKANSGHPGAPMGMADIAEVLWNDHMKHNPGNPAWADRDRFVLSNGHGSMLIYSLLHLTGYDLSLDDLKNFRQLGSKTAGHPEVGHTPGVETTTGPLGQGITNAVGPDAHVQWLTHRDAAQRAARKTAAGEAAAAAAASPAAAELDDTVADEAADEDAAEYEAEDTDAEETEDAEVFEDDDDGDDVLLEDAAELGDDDGVDIDVDSDDDDSR